MRLPDPADLCRRIPLDVGAVLDRLEGEGYPAYLVGGCVRDLLLGEQPADWDVATAARPDEVTALFPQSLPSGIQFGTITVITAQRSIEVTTFRAERDYTDRRHPSEIHYLQDVRVDLGRRDSTINAVALGRDGVLIDPSGGIADLSAGIVRAVGDPNQRLAEDPLRLLRLVRLAAHKGFVIEARTAQAVGRRAADIGSVAGERIARELERMLTHASAERAVRLLVDTGLADALFNELGRTGAEWMAAGRLVGALTEQAPLRWAALMVGVGQVPDLFAVEAVGRRLRWDGRTREAVSRMCRHLPQLEQAADLSGQRLCRIASEVGRSWILPLSELAEGRALVAGTERVELKSRFEEILARGTPLSVRELAIDGTRVMRLGGLSPGAEVGRCLRAALDWVWEEPGRNDREMLERFVRGRYGNDRAGRRG